MFVGGWVRRSALVNQCHPNGRNTSYTAMFEWDGGVRYGSWQHSVAVDSFGRYNTWY